MAEVEVDEVFGFCELSAGWYLDNTKGHTMCDKASKVPAHYAMPCSTFAGIKLVTR